MPRLAIPLLAVLVLAGCAADPDESTPPSPEPVRNTTDENVTDPEGSMICVEGAPECGDTPEPPPYTLP